MIRGGCSIHDQRVIYTRSEGGRSTIYQRNVQYTGSEGDWRMHDVGEGEVDNITWGWGIHQRRVKYTLSRRVKDRWSKKHKSKAGEIHMVAVYTNAHEDYDVIVTGIRNHCLKHNNLWYISNFYCCTLFLVQTQQAIPFFRFMWPCIINVGKERIELDATYTDVYSQLVNSQLSDAQNMLRVN